MVHRDGNLYSAATSVSIYRPRTDASLCSTETIHVMVLDRPDREFTSANFPQTQLTFYNKVIVLTCCEKPGRNYSVHSGAQSRDWVCVGGGHVPLFDLVLFSNLAAPQDGHCGH